MLKRRKYEFENAEKLNLLPLMDAIFIFIFFLLSSSDMNDFREISPAIRKISELTESSEIKDDPLNLKIIASYERLIIQKGLEETVVKSIEGFGEEQLRELSDSILLLKKQYSKENNIIVLPAKQFRFEDIIKVLDAIKQPQLVTKGDETPAIFENIALEPL